VTCILGGVVGDPVFDPRAGLGGAAGGLEQLLGGGAQFAAQVLEEDALAHLPLARVRAVINQVVSLAARRLLIHLDVAHQRGRGR